jgi:hypothetical protein
MSITDHESGRRGLRRRDALAAAGVGLGGLLTAARLGVFGRS